MKFLDNKSATRARASRLVRWLLLVVSVSFLLTRTRPAAADDKRDKQEYGGPKQGKVKPAVLWVPRIVLFVPWLVSEYVLRQPIGLLTRTAEKNQWPRRVVQFFTFGDRDQITLFPSALFDFGLKPSVGFNLGWKYFLAERNALRVHFGTWGPDWIATRAVDAYSLTDRQAISLEGTLINRKDLPFYGIGPESPSSPRRRYQAFKTELALGYEYNYWRRSVLQVRAGMRSLSFGTSSCCTDEGVFHAVDQGQLQPPPGLGQGYIGQFEGLTLTLDSRRKRPANGTGVYLAGHGEGLYAPTRNGNPHRAWLTYGGAAGVSIDTWNGRTVGVGVLADFTDPLTGTIPFTDQVSLGGNRPMRGYLIGRLVDRSAFVATVQYTWPVWVYLDGVVQTDVGNVFGPRLEGFDLSLMRLSAGIGVRSNGLAESAVEILIAGGTDPFNEGFNVSSFRLVIGSHNGF